MASIFNIVMKRYNGTDWDILRPLTMSDNVSDASQTNKFVTQADLDFLNGTGSTTGLKEVFSFSGNGVALQSGKDFYGNGQQLVEFGDISTLTKFIASGGGDNASFTFDGGYAVSVSGTKVVTFAPTETQFHNNGQIIAGASYVPTGAKSLVSKDYVDNVAVNVKPANAVRVASTTNMTLTGVTAIDGVTLSAGNRVLLKDQSTDSQNGIYTFNAGTLTKISPSGNDNVNGTLVFVSEGNTNKNDKFYCIDYSGGAWITFDSNTEIIPGSGISVSGNTVSISNGGVTNTMLAGSINAGKLLKSATFGADGSGNLTIASEGITNAMILEVEMGKVIAEVSTDARAWGTIGDATTARNVGDRFGEILSAIRLLRGTTKYNTSNTDSIASVKSLAEAKNSSTLSNGNPSNTGRVVGDLHFQYET